MRLTGRLEPDFAEPVDEEYRVQTKSRGYMWIRAIAKPVRVDQTTLRWHGALIDITDRRAAEEALRTSEQRFQILADNLPGAVFSYDVDENQRRTPVYVGGGFERLIGKSFARRIREGDMDWFFELIHADDLQRMYEEGQFEASFSDPVDHEYRLRTEYGSYRWVRAIASPIRLDETTLRWHGLVIDISERKYAEERAQESEARLRVAVESLPFDFFVIDNNGRYAMQNAVCREHWGDVVGRRPEEICPDERTLEIWQKGATLFPGQAQLVEKLKSK